MAGKREKPEEIVSKLRQVEVLQGQGMTIAEAVRQIGVTQQRFYRWRRFLPGTPISTSWRCLEMSMATNKVKAVVSVAVIAGLLISVVHAKPLLRPETRLWPPAALFEG